MNRYIEIDSSDLIYNKKRVCVRIHEIRPNCYLYWDVPKNHSIDRINNGDEVVLKIFFHHSCLKKKYTEIIRKSLEVLVKKA